MNTEFTPKEAGRRYRWVFFPAMAVYAVSCFVVPEFLDTDGLVAAVRYAIALIPAVAIWIAIWSQARYFRETDEYERKILGDCGLIAIAFTLAVTTGWGFLEVNAGVPHLSPILILPLFFLFLGLVRLVQKLRESSGSKEDSRAA